jgi:hypothetical protein
MEILFFHMGTQKDLFVHLESTAALCFLTITNVISSSYVAINRL